MIYWDLKFVKCDKYKIAGFCLPKTGSTTIFNILNSLNTPPTEWDKNMANVVTKVPKDYKAFVFVRNPYSRICSSFYNLTYYEQLIGNNKINFSDYITSNLKMNSLYRSPRFISFKSIVPKLPDHTEIYRFEEFPVRMKEILDSIGLSNYPIPHKHPTKDKFRGKDYRNEYNYSTKFLVRCRYLWDLKNLNYTFNSYGELPTIRELKNKL